MGAISLHAAESTFEISAQIITDDTTPPTAPTGLVATVASVSQINLSWNASTDDVAVTNYRIYRDLINIATTSSLTYSDTGLAQDTAYAYTITAIDAAYNESLHSATSTATTTVPVVPTPTTNRSSGSGTRIQAGEQLVPKNFSIVPSETSLVMKWNTESYARSKISWGVSGDYELGSILSEYYQKDHMVVIDHLLPGRTYRLRMELTGGFGTTYIWENIVVRTNDAPDTAPPANPSGFRATRDSEGKVALVWNNPNDSDFDSVRLLRSTKNVPADLVDGKVVYEGAGENAIDQADARLHYYYTIFARDAEGNYSSGAIAEISPAGQQVLIPIVRPPSTTTPVTREIEITQHGLPVSKVNDVHVVFTKDPLRIAVSDDSVQGNVELIIVTMHREGDPENSSSYILSLNKATGKYEADAEIEKEGAYDLQVAFRAHGYEKVRDVYAKIDARSNPESDGEKSFLNTVIGKINLGAIALTLLLALLVIAAFGRLIARRN
jgi:hypothetical protein